METTTSTSNTSTSNTSASNTSTSRTNRNDARRVRNNPNKRVRRNGARMMVLAAFAVGGAALGTGTAAAETGPAGGHSIEGEIPAWEPPSLQTAELPEMKIPTVKDLVGEGAILPEGYTLPDDDAEPEPAEGDVHAEEADSLVQLQPGDLERVRPELADDAKVPQGSDCGDEDFAAKYPEKCPGDEEPDCELADECPQEDGDEPNEPTTTTPETTTTTPEVTTTAVYEDTEVEGKTAERADGELAFTGSGLTLPLVGAGVLAAGAVAAGLSMSAKRRSQDSAGTEA